MIGKIRRGKRVEGLLRYLFGPGTDGQHRNAHIVAGFATPAELEPLAHPNGGRDLRRLQALLNQPVTLLGDRNYDKPVWHLSLRAAPEDPILTDAQWAHIAAEAMDRVGLAPDGDPDGVRWIAVRHADDHIHLVATLARTDGLRPEVWNDGYRVREACLAVEERFGLRRTAPADRTAARRAARGEHEKAHRAGQPRDPRSELRRRVQTAAAAARTESEFFHLLRDDGLLVRLRHSQRQPAQVTGYAVALPEYRTAAGRAVWYGGGKLAADLTLPKLRHRWTNGTPGTGPPRPAQQTITGRGLSDQTARAYLRTALRHAADRSRNATEFFAALEQAGILVRPRYSHRHPDQITGYAVTLPDHHDTDGAARWYSGAKLAPGLSWTALCRHWNGDTGTRDQPPDLTLDERRAIYEDAARAAAFATAQIRCHTVTSPHLARDACWAAADTLRSAAHATGNRHLHQAADAYDRAARAPYGRIPTPTPAGNSLRITARLLALTRTSGSPALNLVTALAAALLTLVDAIGDLHRVHHHEPQAHAAMKAARHLADLTANPQPWLAAQPPKPEPVALAMADFPVPWTPAAPASRIGPHRTPRPGPPERRKPAR
ncbi:hypothetical protein GCM10009678_72540 [Actinomadura kijaniata]|uniref:MobA/VirD2-like nuclease domain-containing protein n=1 Tax=Actinomadura namibiensis TaxID=182080 RepID=A0A7W3QRF2_ACTNM|nr:hypothetical protein [Actinomadura namibiensis]MBA8956562.1 hypothetical protein [Actinomadura namibiensis]